MISHFSLIPDVLNFIRIENINCLYFTFLKYQRKKYNGTLKNCHLNLILYYIFKLSITTIKYIVMPEFN